MSECQELLHELHEALEKKGESYVRQCGFVYQIHIKNASNQLSFGDFTLDLKHGSGFLRPGMDSSADMFISILDIDLVAMAKGKLSTFNALRDGRLSIKGDQLASHVLAEVMERIQRDKRNTAPRPEIQSDEVTLLWRAGAISCGCLVVLVMLILINPFEMKKSAGGPHELEKVAHMSESSLVKFQNGVVVKLNSFSNKAIAQLFLPMEGPKAKHPPPVARPSDVFLAGVPGSGTTWLSHIMHGLRSDASMSFEDILQVVAWWETLGTWNSLSAQQDLKPRLFLSHRYFGTLPSNARYVVLVRDPFQVLQSQFSFFCNSSWTELAGLKRGEMNLNLFSAAIFARVNRNEVWRWILDWYQCCWTKPEALWITYEDFAEDPATQIRKLGKFLLPEMPGSDLVKRVVQQSSRDFMLEHESQFNKHMLLDQIDVFKMPNGTRVRLPRVRDDAAPYEVHPLILEFMDVRWKRMVAPVTGFSTYAELRSAIQQRQLHSATGSVAMPRSHGMAHFLFALMLLTGLLVAFVSLQPVLARSLLTRLHIQGRSQYRRIISHFLDSKKADPELKAGKTSAGGFIV